MLVSGRTPFSDYDVSNITRFRLLSFPRRRIFKFNPCSYN